MLPFPPRSAAQQVDGSRLQLGSEAGALARSGWIGAKPHPRVAQERDANDRLECGNVAVPTQLRRWLILRNGRIVEGFGPESGPLRRTLPQTAQEPGDVPGGCG